eukprot:370943_1
MDSFRTELLLIGYIRCITTLPINSLSSDIINCIKKWNSTTYRLKNTFMIALIYPGQTYKGPNQFYHRNPQSYFNRPKFMPYRIEGHLSVKKLKLIVLKLNDKTGDNLHDTFQLWKWQYVIYKNSNARKAWTGPKYHENRRINPQCNRLGWRGWAYIGNNRLVRNKLKYTEYYWLSVKPPQDRGSGSFSDHDVISNLKRQKTGIIQYHNNYYYWLQRELVKINKRNELRVLLNNKKCELLIEGYLRMYSKSKWTSNDIVCLCLEWYVVTRDYWDINNFNVKTCHIDSELNTVSPKYNGLRSNSHLSYEAFGSINISKATTEKTWRLKCLSNQFRQFMQKANWCGVFVGIASYIDSEQKLKHPYTTSIPYELETNDILIMKYSTVFDYNNECHGELSIGISNDQYFKIFDDIPINGKQVYKLVVQFDTMSYQGWPQSIQILK